MPIKRVVISTNASWNVVNFRRGLVEALQKDGFSITVFAPADEYTPRLRDMNVEHYPITMNRKGVSPVEDLKLLRDYYAGLRDVKPVAYLGYTAKPNVYGSIAARALGIPVINNVAGLGTAFIKGGIFAKTMSHLYRFGFGRSATVFFQNSDDLDMFIKGRIVRPSQVRLLPGSGIDLKRFSAKPVVSARQTRGGLVFLLVGRMLWDKGIGEYVEAARIVKAQWPHARFQLLGFLDAENRSAISRSDVEGWVREGLIEYLGHADDVRPYIAAADCVVLPSYREGLPRVLLEASAMSKPLIATDVPGCRHVVDDGSNGFLCEVRSSHSLSEAIQRMLRLEPEDLFAMGLAARLKVECEFDEQIVIDSYLTAIKDALPPRAL